MDLQEESLSKKRRIGEFGIDLGLSTYNLVVIAYRNFALGVIKTASSALIRHSIKTTLSLYFIICVVFRLLSGSKCK